MIGCAGSAPSIVASGETPSTTAIRGAGPRGCASTSDATARGPSTTATATPATSPPAGVGPPPPHHELHPPEQGPSQDRVLAHVFPPFAEVEELALPLGLVPPRTSRATLHSRGNEHDRMISSTACPGNR